MKKYLLTAAAFLVLASITACGANSSNEPTDEEIEAQIKKNIEELEKADKSKGTEVNSESGNENVSEDDEAFEYYNLLNDEWVKNGDTSVFRAYALYTDKGKRKVALKNNCICLFNLNDSGDTNKGGTLYKYDIKSKQSTALHSRDDIRYEFICFTDDVIFIYYYDNADKITAIDYDGNTVVPECTYEDIFKNYVTNLSSAPCVASFLSDGRSVWNVYSDGKYSIYLLDKNLQSATELPPAEVENEHGFASSVEWKGGNSVIYKNKLYALGIGAYLDLDDMSWHTVELKTVPEPINGDFTKTNTDFYKISGRYILESNLIYDMEEDKIVCEFSDAALKNKQDVINFSQSYYGGMSNIFLDKDDILSSGDIKEFRISSNEGTSNFIKDEALLENVTSDYNTKILMLDKKDKVYIVSDKYYLVEDDYGIFLHEFGADGEEAVMKK